MDNGMVLMGGFAVVWLVAFVIPSVLGISRWRTLCRLYDAGNASTTVAEPVRVLTSPMFYAKPWCKVEPRDDGVLFVPLTRFSSSHGPLLIPWSDLSATPARVMFQPAVALQFAKAEGITVRVGGEVGHALLQRLG